MTTAKTFSSDMGLELFRCRPRSLFQYAKLRNRGSLSTSGWRYLEPIAAVTSPLAESMILAAFPTILFIVVFQKILGLEPPHEPSWVHPAALINLACCFPLAMWWCWIAPGKDEIIVWERGFWFQVSLSRWTWLRSRGNVSFSGLEAFSYRSDSLKSEPLECGKTTPEKLTRLLLDLSLSQYDIRFHLKNNQNLVVEKFFARFNQDDLQRFIDCLGTKAEPRLVTI